MVYAKGARSTNDAIFLAQRMAAEEPERYFMPYQYGNENNPRSHYETTGPEILRELSQVDAFVAGLGTGGTLTGVGRYLKERLPNVKIIAAVPHPGDLVQGLRSLEDGFIPPILDESVLDGRIVVDSQSSFAVVKELMEKEAIFAGISSGAGRSYCPPGGGANGAREHRCAVGGMGAGSISRPACGRRNTRR